MRTISAVAIILGSIVPCFAGEAGTHKIVLIAGKKSHGAGAHEYVKSVQLLKVLLDGAKNLQGIRTEVHLDGWMADPSTLDDADAIVVISDGEDGKTFTQPAPYLLPERASVIDRQLRRGCGLVLIHFSTFASARDGQRLLDWVGGYFDWQSSDSNQGWYSALKTMETDIHLASPAHPISSGVGDFRLQEEFYYRMRLREPDARRTPILLVPALGGTPAEHTVAWAVTRAGGGRGFSTTTGHYYRNWSNEAYRKLILNAIVWAARADVPTNGVQTTLPTDGDLVPR